MQDGLQRSERSARLTVGPVVDIHARSVEDLKQFITSEKDKMHLSELSKVQVI